MLTNTTTSLQLTGNTQASGTSKQPRQPSTRQQQAAAIQPSTQQPTQQKRQA
jgi:hypothetical protein